MKILILSFFLFPSFFSFSQGNLQFNQVLNLENGVNYIVPVGKVLRIESINYLNPSIIVNYSNCEVNCPGCGSSSGVTCSYSSINYLRIGNAILSLTPLTVYITSGGACSVCPSTQTLSVTPSNFTLPIWLNAGKQVDVLASGIYITAVEFNIVP